MTLDLQSLIGKLNPTCRKGLETAAHLCLSQTNYDVEIEHFLLTLLDIPNTDISRLFRYYEIRPEDINKELTLTIEEFRRGNTHTPSLSGNILRILEQAWAVSSIQMDAAKIRSGAILLAILDDGKFRKNILESAPALLKIPRAALKDDIREIIRTSGEESPSIQEPATRNPQPVSGKSETPELDKYTLDLTAKAKAGLIDPIQGRDMEIRQIIDILTRRRQNNPILTGEAGVGKTAVVEGFAIRIVSRDVPPLLENVSIRLLDLGLLQAGAGVKGEFEKRLKSVIDEVKSSPQPIILFIDEAHTLIGAGGAAGQGDAANLLKPALARGELRTIAATTWSEYKKYFEKDPALTRRFQVVQVDEPSEDSAVDMLRGLVPHLESHHNVVILDEAVQDAVRLSHRYISGRQLPDKAISVLDTACARVAIEQNATPPELEHITRRESLVKMELDILEREQISGGDHAERIDELRNDLDALKKREKEADARWKAEAEKVEQIIKLQKNLEVQRSNLDPRPAEAEDGSEAPAEKAEDMAESISQLAALKEELKSLQGKTPMIHTCVDAQVVADVISGWTGIPVGNMLTDEIQGILSLKGNMEERVVGQSDALDTICRRIQTSRARLEDPNKPAGVFFLVGPSGIGKTETAITLADLLYGGDQNMVTLNMSEYQEAHTVSGLKGSPPGYVGYGQGGVLTEAVRRKPYSVVLLDEVEKAHPDVMELFYQVFDKGTLEDAEGLSIDFRNTVILLTSNMGSERILGACRDPQNPPDPETLISRIRPELVQQFKPAFLGRLVIVPYYPLDDEVIQKIVRLKLDKVQKRFEENHKIAFAYSDKLVETISARCTQVDTGARNVDHILTQNLLPELSERLLGQMAAGEVSEEIFADMDEEGRFAYRFGPADVSENAGAVSEDAGVASDQSSQGSETDDTDVD